MIHCGSQIEGEGYPIVSPYFSTIHIILKATFRRRFTMSTTMPISDKRLFLLTCLGLLRTYYILSSRFSTAGHCTTIVYIKVRQAPYTIWVYYDKCTHTCGKSHHKKSSLSILTHRSTRAYHNGLDTISRMVCG